MSTGGKRWTIVQWGDYGEAYERFAAGGEQNYFGQKYTVDYVSDRAGEAGMDAVSVISVGADQPERRLSNGVVTRGVQLYPAGGRARYGALTEAVARSRPTHMTVAMPITSLLRWGVRHGVEMLALFADSFHGTGLRARFGYWQLARALNDPRIKIVSNHSIASAKDLQRIGVSGDKIVPFDWPALITADSYPAKAAPDRSGLVRLTYVGQLVESKGVGDILKAVAILSERGVSVRLRLLGTGQSEMFQDLARSLDIADSVDFLGTRPHGEVLGILCDSHMAVVASHHDYPEGLPMTLYEAMCTRTPLIASDHPMFAAKIRDGETALVFRAGDAAHLADRVMELIDAPDLYERMSRDYGEHTRSYLCPVKWDAVQSALLSDEGLNSLRPYALSRYDYDG
jgi:glycosyltransferase involved in cell wall biosynthesis